MAQETFPSEGDFVLHLESRQKCLTFGQLTMPAAGGPHTLDNVVAYPLLANNVLAVAGDEANVVAFVVAGEPFEDLADNADTEGPFYTILDMFDGAVLNQDVLPANDVDGGNFNAANIMNAAALANVKWVESPDEITEQVE